MNADNDALVYKAAAGEVMISEVVKAKAVLKKGPVDNTNSGKK